MTEVNHRILLRARPTGIPQPDNFIADSVPLRAPAAGEVLLETIFLSIDPAMRSWMSDGPGYQPAVALGAVMRGGGIARVLESRADGFRPGELVQARLGWQTHPTLPAKYLQKVDIARGDALAWIGPLGLSAVTAYFGMRDIGAVKPGERVLVSAAAGGVGQIAAQIARIEACHVVGIAGGTEKCAWLADELRLDRVIDYKAEPDLAAAIGRACPDGIDLYFDNVGGPTLDAALMHLRDERTGGAVRPHLPGRCRSALRHPQSRPALWRGVGGCRASRCSATMIGTRKPAPGSPRATARDAAPAPAYPGWAASRARRTRHAVPRREHRQARRAGEQPCDVADCRRSLGLTT